MPTESVHGAGAVFAGIAQALSVSGTNRLAGLGVARGVLTWAGLAALVMPISFSVVGSPASPQFSNFAPPSLLWHAVYGLALGVVTVGTERRM